MIQDTPYYNRVAGMLARMSEGDSFSINDHVREENKQLFIDCFRWFAAVHADGPWWWEWDDEKNIITKRANYWYRKMQLR